MSKSQAKSNIDNDELLAVQAKLEASVNSAIPVEKEIPKTGAKKTRTAPVPEDKIEVTFHNAEGEAGAFNVFASVNGKGYAYPREKVVSVPREVLSVIDNAVITKTSRSPTGEDIQREVKRYPYSRV